MVWGGGGGGVSWVELRERGGERNLVVGGGDGSGPGFVLSDEEILECLIRVRHELSVMKCSEYMNIYEFRVTQTGYSFISEGSNWFISIP